MKVVKWLGTSRADIQAFPDDVKDGAGHELRRVQNGLQPSDWKPMTSIGSGVEEIRIRDESGAFRVIYSARRAEAVYVLHVFQKKTQHTSLRDLQLACRRLREIDD